MKRVVAVTALAIVLSCCADAQALDRYQEISLDAASGNSAVAGHAQLDVTREHAGFRIRGTVTSFDGCMVLKAVSAHSACTGEATPS